MYTELHQVNIDNYTNKQLSFIFLYYLDSNYEYTFA